MAINDPAELKDLNVIFENILGVAARLAGIAALVMVLVGGFKYLTSGGDPKATEQAKHTLTWAALGLAALVGSWFILKLIATLTGVEGIKAFDICFKGGCPTPPPSLH